MPREELTNNRPLNYSHWHRTLGKRYYALDADWFEMRGEKGELCIVAIIETMQIPDSKLEKANKNYPLTKFKANAYRIIVNSISPHVPFFTVWHNKECSRFLVFDYDKETLMLYEEREYVQFIKSLGNPKYIFPPGTRGKLIV